MVHIPLTSGRSERLEIAECLRETKKPKTGEAPDTIVWHRIEILWLTIKSNPARGMGYQHFVDSTAPTHHVWRYQLGT